MFGSAHFIFFFFLGGGGPRAISSPSKQTLDIPSGKRILSVHTVTEHSGSAAHELTPRRFHLLARFH